MKKLVKQMTIVFILASLSFTLHAQYVNIPDTTFRKFLVTNFPNAMMGSQLDTTDISILNATYISCDSLFIRNLEGIQYFDNLLSLDCSYNLIQSFSSLPNNLISLDCHSNQLNSLPTLPMNLQSLNCMNNHILALPTLPNTLISLNCGYNSLQTLPSLNSLQTLQCNNNSVGALPTFPNSLLTLDCSQNTISSIPSLPLFIQSLNTSSNPIYTLPSLPNSISMLSCKFNSLSILPTLPSSLNTLWCSGNLLTSLPTLPSGLSFLVCDENQLSILPTLPNALTWLNCDQNQIPVLPLLPASLTRLDCAENLIPSLPALPIGLNFLNYSSNPITVLPALPPSLQTLYWNNNTTPILPALPTSLFELRCNYSAIDSLPILPIGLNILECEHDSLTFLPALPGSLQQLDFSNNQLNTMPVLPSGLSSLLCAYNLISTISWLPSGLSSLDCSGNTSLACLPKLQTVMNFVRINNTPINCLPNFFKIIDTLGTSPDVFILPLCMPASGCQCAWNITGNIHADTSSSCYIDSLNPGVRLKNISVILSKNNMFIENMLLTHDGQYSFDTGNNDTLDLMVDTLDMPFHVICPVSFSKQVILTPIDSMKTNINFGVECNGIDAGVHSIIGRFRPAEVTHIQIQAGRMAQFYNVNCPASYSAIVTTVVEGPVQYIMPTATGITPSAVAGNMITYNIPDMSLIDGYSAFGIDVLTDTTAVIGSEVCITTTVSNVIADLNPSNNSMQVCIPVVNSFDPNAKLVSPTDNAQPGDILTYTIHFQNTGNDTAKKIVIRDTLSSNLDLSTFKFLASSHDVEIDLQKNVLVFYFHTINLPDSLHHEPQSHGWLQFKIRLKNNLILSTRTNNTASIYFDYNPPILTDTAINYIGPDPTYAAPSNPIHLPTAITPNGDGLNDSWHILNPQYLDQKQLTVLSVFVMNRWGQKLYTDEGNNFHWNAYDISTSDVFTYFIVYKTRSGNVRNQRGEITVVK